MLSFFPFDNFNSWTSAKKERSKKNMATARKRNPSTAKSAAIKLLESRVEELEEQLSEYQEVVNQIYNLTSDYSDINDENIDLDEGDLD